MSKISALSMQIFFILCTAFSMMLQMPILTFFAFFSSLLLLFVQFSSYIFSIISASLIPMLGIGLVETWSRFAGAPFQALIGGAFLLVELVILASIARKDSGFKIVLPEKPKIFIAIAAIIPGIISILLLNLGGNLSGNDLSWVLQGDAQNNTNSSLEIIFNNGFSAGLPSIAQGVMSAAIAGTIGNNLSADSFISMMQIQATSLALLWCITSLIFGLAAAREFDRYSLRTRIVATLCAATLPLTWFILGFSIDAGFYNTPFALIAVMGTWICWREINHFTQKHFFIPVTILFAFMIFALMAWTPLAAIPASFLAVTAYFSFFRSNQTKKKIAASLLIGALVLVAFAVRTLLPSLGVVGNVAAAEGWMTELSPKAVAAILVFALLSSTMLGVKFSQPGDGPSGLVILIFSTTAGVGILFLQSLLATNSFGWSYYPRKMAWLSVFCVIAISAMLIIAYLLGNEQRGKFAKISGILTTLTLLFIALFSVPTTSQGPLKYLPFAYISLSNDSNTDTDTDTIHAISETLGNKEIRLIYDENDYLVNQWVFQWAKFQNPKPIWTYAYSLIQSPTDVCNAAETWGGGVTLRTSSEKIETEVIQQCGELISGVARK